MIQYIKCILRPEFLILLIQCWCNKAEVKQTSLSERFVKGVVFYCSTVVNLGKLTCRHLFWGSLGFSSYMFDWQDLCDMICSPVVWKHCLFEHPNQLNTEMLAPMTPVWSEICLVWTNWSVPITKTLTCDLLNIICIGYRRIRGLV